MRTENDLRTSGQACPIPDSWNAHCSPHASRGRRSGIDGYTDLHEYSIGRTRTTRATEFAKDASHMPVPSLFLLPLGRPHFRCALAVCSMRIRFDCSMTEHIRLACATRCKEKATGMSRIRGFKFSSRPYYSCGRLEYLV